MAAERPGDFGSRLREARERKGVSLRQIAARTKISVAALEALERNDISRLPGGIFSRAFVRAFAQEVGLDPETTIQDFVAQFPHDSVVAGHSTSDPIEDRVALESDRQMARTVLWMLMISVPVAGLVLYIGAMRRNASREAPAPVAVTALDAPTRAPSADTTPAAPAATAGSAPTPAVTPTSTVAPAPPTGLRATASGSPAPSTPAGPVAATPRATTQLAAELSAPDRLTVGLVARRPVYVSATADGRTVISRLLQPGERTSVEVAREMTITAGDAAALSLTLNGADARPLGRAGEVVSTRLTLANFKDYLQNR